MPYRTVKRIIGSCLRCGKVTRETEKRVALGRGKFCSRTCAAEYNARKHIIGFKLGNSIGLDNLVPAKKGVHSANYKGENVKYSGLHIWIRRQLGEPKKCEVCGSETAKKYEWANIDHKYRRNLIDWKRMCTSCHKKYDNKMNVPRTKF
jgi:hypothetical protein